jgi:hypothetical protein
MPTAAVIIAARDAAAWLHHCVEAVSFQRLPRGWRTIILLGIDACPATLRTATRLAMPNLTVRFFPERVGPYVIFNSLAHYDGSDVLVRFDADDVMLADYLSAQLALLDRRLSPMITQTWSIYVDRDLRPVAARLANGSLTNHDGRRFSGSDGQFLMTRAVWNRLGAFQPWWCQADSEFIQRAVWSGVARRSVPRHLYLRRVHPSSLTQSETTGYDSEMRRFYSQQIAVARERYARGSAPERIHPGVATAFSPMVAVD